MDSDPWASTELAEAPTGWIRATENGWGALVVWAAGPANFVRVPAVTGDRYGMTVHRDRNGGERQERFVLSNADLESIDDDIDSYLADAGLPPRPRGYDWFIRRPPNMDRDGDAFWSAVWAAATATLPDGAVRPSTVKGFVKEALARMYQG